MQKCLFLILICWLCCKTAFSQSRPVDVVFCMDLSGSTNGLIDDLRDHIWDIALQFKAVKPSPLLRIGVVGYSRPSFGKTTGYAKLISPLSADLDQVSFDLFGIHPYIEKGDQLVGSAIQLAVRSPNWSREPDAVKIIFVIGNGGVHLGSVNFRDACDEAVLKKILVYPVFCTRADKSKEMTGWLEIARRCSTEVKEMLIHKKTPFETTCSNLPALKEVNDGINKTCIYYGENGYNRFKLLRQADANALLGGAMNYEARIYYKSRFITGRNEWDLVDHMKVNGKLPVFDHNTLPDSLKLVADDYLLRTVLRSKETRERLHQETASLLPADRPARLKKQMEAYSMEKVETLERMVVDAYMKSLLANGFIAE